jgi:FkbM family methyltransferase
MNQVEIVFNNQKVKGVWRDEVDASVWAEIFKWREYRIVEDVIKSGDAKVFDIGAHAGFFALYCLALNDKVKIVSVEPEEKNLQALANNLKLNNQFKKVKILSGALALVDGDCFLKVTADSHNHHILANNENGEGVKKVVGFSLLNLAKRNKVKKIDLLKMDIEGSEFDLLESWGDEEWRVIANLVFEYHERFDHNKDELLDILGKNGFGIQVFPSRFDKTMGIIFANNKRIKK